MAGTVWCWCRNRPLRSWRTWRYAPSFRMQDNTRASVELTFVPWWQAKATTTIQSRGGGAQQPAAAVGDRAWGQQLTVVSAGILPDTEHESLSGLITPRAGAGPRGRWAVLSGKTVPRAAQGGRFAQCSR